MRKHYRFLLALILCAFPAFAQTTTYTGTIKDLTGTAVTSGRVTFTLSPPGVSQIPGAGTFVSSTVSCLINASGNVVASDGSSPCVVASNSALTPTGTSYKICIQPSFVTPGACMNSFAFGGTVDLTTIVPTPATQPSYGVGATNGIAPLDSTTKVPLANLPSVTTQGACALSGCTMTGPLHGTADTATHAQNIPADFATQSAASPSSANFTTATATNTVQQFNNGVPQADQFAGADICAKLRAAALYAISNHINQVDATHFSGVQTCSSDPFNALATIPSPVNLTVNLGAVHIQTSVVWNINNQGFRLIGQTPYTTQIEYTGAATDHALMVGTTTPATTPVYGMTISDLFVYGGNANLTDVILFEGFMRSEARNIYTWGATKCGIHTKFAVTDTFYRPHTSTFDASTIAIFNASHTVPASGLCFDQAASGEQTTAGTVIDPAAEFLNGTGIMLDSASSMVFTGGSSENNQPVPGSPGGIFVAAGSNHNSFIGLDMEGNTNFDVFEGGQDNHYIGVIANSQNSLGQTLGIQLASTSAYITVDGGNEVTVTDLGTSFSRFNRGSNNLTPFSFNGNAGVTINLACPSGQHINAISIQGGIIVTGPTCN